MEGWPGGGGGSGGTAREPCPPWLPCQGRRELAARVRDGGLKSGSTTVWYGAVLRRKEDKRQARRVPVRLRVVSPAYREFVEVSKIKMNQRTELVEFLKQDGIWKLSGRRRIIKKHPSSLEIEAFVLFAILMRSENMGN